MNFWKHFTQVRNLLPPPPQSAMSNSLPGPLSSSFKYFLDPVYLSPQLLISRIQNHCLHCCSWIKTFFCWYSASHCTWDVTASSELFIVFSFTACMFLHMSLWRINFFSLFSFHTISPLPSFKQASAQTSHSYFPRQMQDICYLPPICWRWDEEHTQSFHQSQRSSHIIQDTGKSLLGNLDFILTY